MLRTILVLLAVIVALAAAQTATPVLMFASQKYFNEQKTNPATLTSQDMTAILDQIIKGNNDKASGDVLGLNAQKIPTTVMVFTVNKLTSPSATKALGFYGNPTTIDNIASNYQFYYPNALQTNTALFYRSIMVAADGPSEQFFPSTAQCADIVTLLKNANTAFSASQNNLFIQAKTDDIALVNTCLPDIMSILDNNTQSKYLLIIQGAIDTTVPATVSQLSQDTVADPIQVAPKRTDGQVGPQYVTAGTLVALFAVFVLLGFGFFGFSKMLGVEGPLRYPVASHLPPATREY